MSLDSRLLEIKDRAQKATPGPWKTTYAAAVSYEDDGIGWFVAYCDTRSRGVNLSLEQCRRNAEFIAHSRTDVPRLIEVCRILARAVEAKTKFEDHYVSCRVCKHDWYCQEGNALYGASLDAYKTALRLVETGEVPE